ncbi:MAG: bifunctional 2-polyprenyl-6-hydroxyphenol methylase/3-demethylubiquinol 3-O-methyltransferase UbiG [Alphaproteobacteria bacterium]|nr:MAG: bifunctional 2-polyprenyl-6-hydroxyphenol methylase/3-demethylubiquinol 3-O-methyltransferase UbiG [Alphaproteobacteria bacterium]
MTQPARATLDPQEVATFDRIAEHWWDPSGPLRMLHRMNPARLRCIGDIAAKALDIPSDPASRHPLRGVTVLDIGCGGGLLCEPLARQGAAVTGLDASPKAIQVARRHAKDHGLEIAYHAASLDTASLRPGSFDLVLGMEIIEHTADAGTFVQAAAKAVRPGGALILSTLNRTWMARLLAVELAEHVLGWAEPGSHDWHRFLRPHELARLVRQQGMEVGGIMGMPFDPLTGAFSLSPHKLGINYMLWARKLP